MQHDSEISGTLLRHPLSRLHSTHNHRSPLQVAPLKATLATPLDIGSFVPGSSLEPRLVSLVSAKQFVPRIQLLHSASTLLPVSSLVTALHRLLHHATTLGGSLKDTLTTAHAGTLQHLLAYASTSRASSFPSNTDR